MRLTQPVMEMTTVGSQVHWSSLLGDMSNLLAGDRTPLTKVPNTAVLQAIATGAYLLPVTEGQIFSGEKFRAYLSVSNQQPVVDSDLSLSAANFRIRVELWPEGHQPPTILDSPTNADSLMGTLVYSAGFDKTLHLKPGEFHDTIIEFFPPQVGNYSLVCNLGCDLVKRIGDIDAEASAESLASNQAGHAFHRRFNLSVKHPFDYTYRLSVTPCGAKVLIEVTLKSNCTESAISLRGIEILSDIPSTAMRIEPVGKVSLPCLFETVDTQHSFLFVAHLLNENQLHQTILNQAIGNIKLTWRSHATYTEGTYSEHELRWTQPIIEELTPVIIRSLTDEDSIDDSGLACRIKALPKVCTLGVPFSSTLSIGNLAVLESIKVALLFPPRSNEEALVALGKFPVRIEKLEPGNSRTIDVTWFPTRKGLLAMPRIVIEADSKYRMVKRFKQKVLCL